MVLLPPAVNLDANMAFHLTVQVWDAPATTLRLDFSLQRHHYRYTDTGHSEAMNSLFHADVTTDAIRAEMVEIGQQLQARAAQTQQQATTLAQAAMEAARKAGGSPAAPVGAANMVRGAWQPPTALWDDFRVRSGRVYRVDATNQQARTTHVNHLYVISGMKVWGGVTQQGWLAAQALRRVEMEADARGVRPEQLPAKFDSMRKDPTQSVQNNTLFKQLDAARTTFRAGAELEALKQVSGNAALVIALGQIAKSA